MKLTDSEWNRVREQVEATAIARKDLKTLKSEVDYFAGAMEMLNALTGDQPPAYWVMTILCGRSIVKEAIKQKEKADEDRG